MVLADLALYTLALAGHTTLWLVFQNQVLATAMPRWALKTLTTFAHLCLVMAPVWWLLWARSAGWEIVGRTDWSTASPAQVFYVLFCAVFGLVVVPPFFWRRLTYRPPQVLRSNDSQYLDIASRMGYHPVGEGFRRVYTRLPRNEVFRLEVNEKLIQLPRLPRSLDGLSIAHISDLHYTGAVAEEFFHEIVDLVNTMQPDLIALTGDVVDKFQCIDWIGPTLGKLRAVHGAYFVLGNHDLYVKDVARLRRTLVACEFVDLGSRWLSHQIGEGRVILAGNELPWIAPAADMTGSGAVDSREPSLRILLAHSPDQLAWARRRDFDLMLAGHTHGGQIRLPWIGPVVTPSRKNVRYASGVFHEPPTVMHVSRGVSSLMPLRWNCLPEITKLVLRAPQP